MVQMTEEKAMELIPLLQSPDQTVVQGACLRIQRMLKTNEATLAAWPMVRTVDRSRAVSETASEARFPTEFEPPQEPQGFGRGYEPPKPGPIDASTVESLPVAFETRNLEVTLQVFPVVLPSGTRVHLEFDLWRVRLIKMEDYGLVLTAHNTLISVPIPLFETVKSQLDFTINSGERQLICRAQIGKTGKPLRTRSRPGGGDVSQIAFRCIRQGADSIRVRNRSPRNPFRWPWRTP